MRLNEVMGISMYDLKTWLVISIMTTLVVIFEAIILAYYHNQSLQAHVILMAMSLCCFYNQGFLAGIAITRCAIKEERECSC